MKRIITAALLILTLLTGCELFYPEAESDIYFVSVALSYQGIDDINKLEGTLPDQAAMRGQLKLLTERSGKIFREVAITQDNGIAAETQNLDISLESTDVKSLLIEAIEEIEKIINANDIFIFYYSGHGNTDGSIVFTLDSEMKPEELLSSVKTINSRKLLILDCCYSGNYVEDGSGSSSFTDAYNSIFKSNKAEDDNLWVMAAAQKNQLSWEQGKHGCFTESILRITGYDIANEKPAAKTGETISFLSISSRVPYNISVKLGKGNAELEQYPNYTLTGRDLVLFNL